MNKFGDLISVCMHARITYLRSIPVTKKCSAKERPSKALNCVCCLNMPRARNVSSAQAAYASKVAASLGASNVSKMMSNRALKEAIPELSEDMCKAMRDSGVMNKLVANKSMTQRVATASKGVDLSTSEGVSTVLSRLTKDRTVMTEIIRSSESLLGSESSQGIKASLAKHMQSLSEDPEAMAALKEGMPNTAGALGSTDMLKSVRACVVLMDGEEAERKAFVSSWRADFVGTLIGAAAGGDTQASVGSVVVEDYGSTKTPLDAVIVLAPCMLSKALASDAPLSGLCDTARAAASDFYKGAGREVRGDTFLPAGVAFAVGTTSASMRSRRVLVAPCMPVSTRRALSAALCLAVKHGWSRVGVQFQPALTSILGDLELPEVNSPAVHFPSEFMVTVENGQN